jgi:ferric-dicitrate binding protein FerR (iron transport regulator)
LKPFSVAAGDKLIVATGMLVSGVYNMEDTRGFVSGVTGVFPVVAEAQGDTIVLKSARR